MTGIRWGLCCVFLEQPVRFRSATHAYVRRLGEAERWRYLRTIAFDNVAALGAAQATCQALGIGAFRVNSQLFPLATHPASGYSLAELDPDGALQERLVAVARAGDEAGIRRSLHPDQFVVLGSVRDGVVDASLREFEWQAEVAAWIGADVVVVHGGSAAGGLAAGTTRLARGIARLSPRARAVLALENDDRSFTPAALLPLCTAERIPLVYDVHHHRCLPDGESVGGATAGAIATWGGREPYFHISSPRGGWQAPNPRAHADYIDPADVPLEWHGLKVTVDVEAKAKELAVLRLMQHCAGAAGGARGGG